MSEKRYVVTITEKVVETVIEGKDWRKVSDDPKDKFAYTPEIEKKVEVKRLVYQQDTDTLNLIDVIKAVNNI